MSEPSETLVDDAAAVARAAAHSGGAALLDRYRHDDGDADYRTYDVKAEADEAAEREMLPSIRRAFPDHAIFAEESGEFPGEAPYRWIVDPLDGTNNFTAGLPTFATSVALLHEDDPLLAAVYQPVTGELYTARRGEGVRYNGERVSADSDLALAAATVGVIVGRRVPRDPDRSAAADAIRKALAGRAKRVVDSWAPTVHSGLFARGRIQGLVQFFPDEEEQDVTELLAAEAGAVARRDGPLWVGASDEEKLEGLWTAVQDATYNDEWL